MEGVQTQLRYAQLRVQSLEQELKSVKQELEQKVMNSIIVLHVKQTNCICFLEKRKYRIDKYL